MKKYGAEFFGTFWLVAAVAAPCWRQPFPNWTSALPVSR